MSFKKCSESLFSVLADDNLSNIFDSPKGGIKGLLTGELSESNGIFDCKFYYNIAKYKNAENLPEYNILIGESSSEFAKDSIKVAKKNAIQSLNYFIKYLKQNYNKFRIIFGKVTTNDLKYGNNYFSFGDYDNLIYSDGKYGVCSLSVLNRIKHFGQKNYFTSFLGGIIPKEVDDTIEIGEISKTNSGFEVTINTTFFLNDIIDNNILASIIFPIKTRKTDQICKNAINKAFKRLVILTKIRTEAIIKDFNRHIKILKR